MNPIHVGAGYVSFVLRNARSLKDKRQVTRSVSQRLKNEGFSVVETDCRDNPKRGTLALAFIGTSATFIDEKFDFALNLFNEEFEIVDKKKEVFELGITPSL